MGDFARIFGEDCWDCYTSELFWTCNAAAVGRVSHTYTTRVGMMDKIRPRCCRHVCTGTDAGTVQGELQVDSPRFQEDLSLSVETWHELL